MFYQQSRQMTPPSMMNQIVFPASADSYQSTRTFFSSARNSPESVLTHLTTPSRDCSPGTTLCQSGPPLLPKIRNQDQTTEPSSSGPIRHHRAVSAQAGIHYSPYPYGIQRQPAKHQRTPSPEGRHLASPATTPIPPPAYSSALSNSPLSSIAATVDPSYAVQSYSDSCDFGFGGPLNSSLHFPDPHASRRSSLAHVRTSSLPVTPVHSHSRSTSGSSVDDATIRRHGYPTQYRNMPQFRTQTPPLMIAPPMQFSVSGGTSFLMNEPPHSFDDDLASISFPEETTSLLSYLTTPNPKSLLIAQSTNTIHNPTSTNKSRDWWWWDVRTLRSWKDFNIDTILSVKDFPALLHYPQDAAAFPHPPAEATEKPADEQKLREIHHRFFSTKIKTAVKAATGKDFFMSTRDSRSNTPWPKPDFISNYTNDYATTHRGEPRGRLVGLVKAYDLWNCAQRTGEPLQQVRYLHGLSHLHRVMRENGCRYGFIITEIELVCVRMGAKDGELLPSTSQPHHLDEGPVPWYGYLEIAPRIELSTSGCDEVTGAPRLTAALALWYLHMLSKEGGLPGQPGWKIGVGGPAARTRQFCVERDGWMPRIHDQEKRHAKTVRGWVMPEDPWNKKENIKKRK
ncbi:sialidase-like protein [Venturia nashicola]|uniref:Sialidase-like protein n=1 Tax=Venturia nashicola TaxID=86259 RepID=A0A4Z1PHJ9_9PEZI|nr:sialidase-like protein [Venturia nashicola]